jgi:transcription elongation GreA/GreB family factor
VASYSIVYPGAGDPARSCISADSPLGAALLGARPGATVEVAAPGGSWSAVVLGIA